jgi:hypothetical protein
MSGKAFFEKNGFHVIDQAPPDFDLVVKKFDDQVPDPKFIRNWEKPAFRFEKGLFIIKADQCPYTVKNVKEICDTASARYGIKPEVIILQDHREAQTAPNPFGTFSIVFNNRVIAHHPISNKRFMNIMDHLTKVYP